MTIQSALRLIVSVFFLSILPAQVHALTPAQVFDQVKDAVVVVKALDAQGKPKAQGSGVLLPTGKIATNCHVVEGGASYQVGQGNQLVPATLFAEDGDKDICLLDAKGIQGKPVQIGKAAGLKVGDPVYAVGAPRGLELSLSDGIVAQLRGGPPPFIQTTAAISPGSSGGGLFDSEGRLVGLTTLYIEGGQSLNFAIPVEWIGEIKPGRKTVAGGRSQIEWTKRTIALEKMKDYQGLLDWCLKWTKSQPENAWAWYGLGVAYVYLNRYDDAVDAYRQSIRIDPETDAWIELGTVYHDLKRYNDAVDSYRQALHFNPNDASAYYNLGNVYINLKRPNDAIDAFRQALRINPKHVKAWNNLGVAYYNLKRYNDAIKAYRQALWIDPKYVEAWHNLGNINIKLKLYDDAIEAFRQAIGINPEADAWLRLGLTYFELKRYDDAIEAYRQAIRINPEQTVAWYSLGQAYSNLNREDDAIDAFRQVLRIDPKYAEAWYFLGLTYGHLTRWSDAIEAFRQALRIDPEHAEAWHGLALAYVISGNRTAALDAVQKLRRLDPKRADELFDRIVPR